VNPATRRIAAETLERCLDAISNGEAEGAEFLVWWERLAGLHHGMAGPQTWKRLQEISQKMVGIETEAGRDDGGLY